MSALVCHLKERARFAAINTEDRFSPPRMTWIIQVQLSAFAFLGIMFKFRPQKQPLRTLPEEQHLNKYMSPNLF